MATNTDDIIAFAAMWDQRYRDSAVTEPPPAAEVLTDNAHLLPKQGTALDLACGLGGNALRLAAAGLTAYGWDLSAVALEKLAAFAAGRGLSIATEVRDVSRQPPPPGSFDVIVVSRFLERDLAPALSAALRPQGLLFYQTFTQLKVNDSGPSNPDYLLAQNELLRLFSGLTVLAYREEGRCGDVSAGLRNQAYLVAQKP